MYVPVPEFKPYGWTKQYVYLAPSGPVPVVTDVTPGNKGERWWYAIHAAHASKLKYLGPTRFQDVRNRPEQADWYDHHRDNDLILVHLLSAHIVPVEKALPLFRVYRVSFD